MTKRTKKPCDRRRAEELREAVAARHAAGLAYLAAIRTARLAERDWPARLAEIPPDTRDFAARLLGDPLPGRSALDRRRVS